jgi:hypothetical protein
MGRKLKVLGAIGVAAASVALWGQAVGAGSPSRVHAQTLPNNLTVQAVITGGGAPTSPITIHQGCTGATGTKDFTNVTAGTVGTTDIGVSNDCTVTATANGGAASVTYACAATGNNMTCAAVAAHNEATSGPAPNGGAVTITVTFTFPPPPPPPPVVTPARFTG